MKKEFRYIVDLILLLCIVAIVGGCSSKKQQPHKSDFLIYHMDSNGTKLVGSSYRLKADETQAQISEVLEQLHAEKKGGNSRAIPDSVMINRFSLVDGVLTVDFGENYNLMNPENEVLCRAAVVCTLDQIEGVDSVAFTIQGVPYRQNSLTAENTDNAEGAMKSSDFISGLRGSDIDMNTDDFKLYFGNAKGNKLKEYKLKNVSYRGKSKEEFIVEQLIKGPEKEKYTRTLSIDTELISVATAGNICYVDFGQNFLTGQSFVPSKLVIYSIVNSLLELDYIHKVQISVEGDSVIKYRNDISLSEPFIRNLDLVSESK